MKYRRFIMTLAVNGIRFHEVWIDPHYEERHSESINDQLVLKLVKLLDGTDHDAGVIGSNEYSFFATDMEFEGNPYRLIWVIPPDHSFLGVRNAFRRSK